jgi:hypothetical protein
MRGGFAIGNLRFAIGSGSLGSFRQKMMAMVGEKWRLRGAGGVFDGARWLRSLFAGICGAEEGGEGVARMANAIDDRGWRIEDRSEARKGRGRN